MVGGGRRMQSPAEKKQRDWLINSIKNHNKNPKRVKEVIRYVKENGGLIYAENKMESFKNQALGLLEAYASSAYKESLEQMVNYVIERKK